MQFTVNGAETFASSGGRAHKPGEPNVVFIHGSGQNRLTWTQQARKAAYRGYNVMALDLPGHGNSAGSALASVEATADWVVDAMDAVGFKTAHLVGHSQGCLEAMEIASRYPARVKKLALVASALSVPVNDALVEWAANKPARAFSAMTGWGLGEIGHMHDNTVPGHSHISGGVKLMAMNQADALHTDLVACNAYTNGKAAAAAITCPTLVVLASQDKMTPIKFGRKLVDAISGAQSIELSGTGHMIPAERPQELNKALYDFWEQ